MSMQVDFFACSPLASRICSVYISVELLCEELSIFA
jgi:hypothetical protein